jgi:putative glycosyltransferase (TIGR04372 family)
VFNRLRRYGGLCVAVLLLIVASSISRFVLIRFGLVKSSRIGHLAHELEQYVLRSSARTRPEHGRTLDLILLEPPPVANKQLVSMWKRSIPGLGLVPSSLQDPLRRLTAGPIFSRHAIEQFGDTVDRHNLRDLTNTPIRFTEEEKCAGSALAQQIGLEPATPFVCFFSRDQEYLQRQFPNANWDKHAYRNSSPEQLVRSLLWLEKAGYYCIRMGKYAADAPSIPYSDRIIDYAASSLQSDFLDIYLFSRCSFFLGTPSGITNIPRLFRRPCALYDFAPIDAMFSPALRGREFAIPKLYRDSDGKRLLSLTEIFARGLHSLFMSESFRRERVELVNNEPEDILLMVQEIIDRSKRQWTVTIEEKTLRKEFVSLLSSLSTDPINSSTPLIPFSFLRKHQNWLIS